MPLVLFQRDITRLPVDAIVNAANSRLAPGGGVCGAIFAAAGYDQLDRACRKIGGCPTGQAVITEGFDLPAKYVIHAVGPIWCGGGQGEEASLRSCYENAISLARDNGCTSIAFPLISSGIYGYPREEALRVAVEAICGQLVQGEMEVYLALFGHDLTALARENYPELWRD